MPGQALGSTESVVSCDTRFTLVMQSDGNLVLYGPTGALWSTQTQGTAAQNAVMQSDGNLVVYTSSSAVWSSQTEGNPGASLSVQDDGNLVIYSGSSALWTSNTCCH